MLQIEGLCVSVNTEKGEQKILDGLDLTVEDGKFVVITGPNGGGKTTLAKAIIGIMPASGGKIIYNGEDITALNVTERAKKGISYGFQQPPRFKGMTVRRLMNIAAGKELTKDECCAFLSRVGLCSAEAAIALMETERDELRAVVENILFLGMPQLAEKIINKRKEEKGE